MTIGRDAINRRILVIDDNVNIHEDFRKILSPPIESGALDPDDSQEPVGAMLREKAEFLAIMSHEILTSMNELIAKVTLLLDSPLNPVQRQHASTLEHCAQDLLSLIKDMHEFLTSRRQETEVSDQP